MKINQDVRKWLDGDGGKFLRRIGLKTGQEVLDFGCGKGNYTISAARIVGEKGKIYAIDKDKEALSELSQRAKIYGLKNIEMINTSGKLEFPLLEESIDVALLYDVLHSYYFDKIGDRKKLLNEIYRVLKPGALLSIFPKHFEIEIENIIKEIEKVNFSFEKKFEGILMHNDNLVKDFILNFTRRSEN